MTILAADIGFLDLIQGWDLIARQFGIWALAIPAAIASAIATLVTLWMIIRGALRIISKVCAIIASTMDAVVKGIINQFFGGIAEIAKNVFAWARGKMKK